MTDDQPTPLKKQRQTRTDPGQAPGHLDALDVPAEERMEKRLRAFHAGLERYPLQLSELDLAEYLEIKRRDASRVQQARQ
jgi:hypothetical protein